MYYFAIPQTQTLSFVLLPSLPRSLSLSLCVSLSSNYVGDGGGDPNVHPKSH